MKSFWRYYQGVHPEHAAFSTHSHRLHRVLPLALFGDEGRGPKRGQFLIWTLESLLGVSDAECKCHCKDMLGALPKVDVLTSDDCFRFETGEMTQFLRASNQAANSQHHSYLSRHVLFGMPSFLYKTNPSIEHTHILKMVEDIQALFTSGVSAGSDTVWFGAVLGSKGDFKHQALIGNLERSYHSIGLTAGNMMCSHCEAGADGIQFEKADYDPKWAQTLHVSRPWTIRPDLTMFDYDESKPEHLLKFDLFHLWKVGLGRDVAGSAVLVFCRLGLFDIDGESNNIDVRLERAFGNFRLWCIAEKKSPGLRSFTKAFFNAKTQAQSPWSNSKGSDTTLLNQWICWFCRLHVETPTDVSRNHAELLKLLIHTTQASFDMFEILYTHGLWLERPCAKLVFIKLMQMMRGYRSLANMAVAQNRAAWGFKPKYHGLHHVAYDLRVQLLKGCKLCLNPIVWGNEQNEDTIGRVSRLSRIVSTRTITRRVLNRYFLKKRALLKRFAVLGQQKVKKI